MPWIPQQVTFLIAVYAMISDLQNSIFCSVYAGYTLHNITCLHCSGNLVADFPQQTIRHVTLNQSFPCNFRSLVYLVMFLLISWKTVQLWLYYHTLFVSNTLFYLNSCRREKKNQYLFAVPISQHVSLKYTTKILVERTSGSKVEQMEDESKDM